VGFFDFFKRKKRAVEPGQLGSGVPGNLDFGESESDPMESGEGGPSLYRSDLSAIRWAAQAEAVNVGRMPLDPEHWPEGELEFPYERHLAHEHEGLRDRLADFVSARARESLRLLYQRAQEVANTLTDLKSADSEYAGVLQSWNRVHHDVHGDELELARYFRLNSQNHQIVKWTIAVVLFGTEFAISIALFDQVIAGDIPILPPLFALGLILVLLLVPHYAAVGLKEGVTRYHEAEMETYRLADATPPTPLRRKSRLEEVEDKGIRLVASLVGLFLVILFIPLSSLRASELSGDSTESKWFWFAFYLLLQLAISGYFFLREWIDHGTSAVNLLHHDKSKSKALTRRDYAFKQYCNEVTCFMDEAQDLTFLYRQAPRWDSYLVQTHLSTLYAFRHIVAVHQPDLDYFITHARMPVLGVDQKSHTANEPGGVGVYPVWLDHPELKQEGAFSRAWWMQQLEQALLVEARSYISTEDADLGEGENAAPSEVIFESPQRLLKHLLATYFGQTFPYLRPAIFDELPPMREVEEVLPSDQQTSPETEKSENEIEERVS
jgi:hypothetical protein